MPGELHDLSVQIGRLQEGLRLLTQTVRDNQELATEEHRKVHDIVVATSEAVRNLAAEVAEMKPLTEDYREKRAEARGAAHLIKWLYVMGGGLVSAGAMRIMDAFNAKPPHP